MLFTFALRRLTMMLCAVNSKHCAGEASQNNTFRSATNLNASLSPLPQAGAGGFLNNTSTGNETKLLPGHTAAKNGCGERRTAERRGRGVALYFSSRSAFFSSPSDVARPSPPPPPPPPPGLTRLRVSFGRFLIPPLSPRHHPPLFSPAALPPPPPSPLPHPTLPSHKPRALKPFRGDVTQQGKCRIIKIEYRSL